MGKCWATFVDKKTHRNFFGEEKYMGKCWGTFGDKKTQRNFVGEEKYMGKCWATFGETPEDALFWQLQMQR